MPTTGTPKENAVVKCSVEYRRQASRPAGERRIQKNEIQNLLQALPWKTEVKWANVPALGQQGPAL